MTAGFDPKTAACLDSPDLHGGLGEVHLGRVEASAVRSCFSTNYERYTRVYRRASPRNAARPSGTPTINRQDQALGTSWALAPARTACRRTATPSWRRCPT